MGLTAIQIVNLAMTDCGVNPITSLTPPDGSKESVVANAKYAAIRDFVLESREWTFAKKRVILQKENVVPAFGYTFSFAIPSGCIRVVRVYDSLGSTGNGFPGALDDSLGAANGFPNQVTDWVREGFSILTNEDAPLYAELLMRVDEGTFSPGMVMALAERLVAAFAIPITENRQLKADAIVNYERLMVEAGAMDGSQGRTQSVRPPALPGRRQNL